MGMMGVQVEVTSADILGRVEEFEQITDRVFVNRLNDNICILADPTTSQAILITVPH